MNLFHTLSYVWWQAINFSVQAVVVEETNWDYVMSGKYSRWKAYIRTCSDINCCWMRNGLVQMYIAKVHVILIPDELQLVIHNNLHRNIHYSVSDKNFVRHLHSFCNFNDIKIAVYKEDRSYTKVDNIIVINNFSSNFKKLCYSKLKLSETLDMIKKSGNNRKKATLEDGP